MEAENLALQRLNAQSEKTAWDELLRCCGASKWALKMMTSRPFPGVEALLACSEKAFEALTPLDWREAFSHHPQIGDIESLRLKFAATSAWAEKEQVGTQAASEAILQELARGNQDYLDKFGFIFIICATGKSAAEMLSALQNRLQNDLETELWNAAEQQKMITRLRLDKLLES